MPKGVPRHPGGPGIIRLPAGTSAGQRFGDRLFAPGTHEFAVDAPVTDGEVGLLTWHACGPGTDIPFAADTFIVRDGRIRSRTFAVGLQPA